MFIHTVAHYRIGVCIRPTLRGEKHFYSTATTVSSFTKAQKCLVIQQRIRESMFAHDHHWEEKNTLSQQPLLTFCMLGV